MFLTSLPWWVSYEVPSQSRKLTALFVSGAGGRAGRGRGQKWWTPEEHRGKKENVKASRLAITWSKAKNKTWCKGIECYLGACGADQLGFELALEEVYYKGVISHLVPLPCFLRHHLHQHTKKTHHQNKVKLHCDSNKCYFSHKYLSKVFILNFSTDFHSPFPGAPVVKNNTYFIQTTVGVHGLGVRFILDAVQVLMEPVQQESHELLGVVLGVTCKLTGFTGHNCLWIE